MKMQPLASEAKEWRLAIDSTKEIAGYASDFSVVIGIEPINRFETYFINRANQALKLVEDVNMENVGVTLDNFHLNIEESDSADAIRKTGDRLVNFHVADNNRMPAGQGQSDWKAITNALKEINYDKYIIMEYLPPVDRTPLKTKRYEAETDEENISEFLLTHGTTRLTKEYYDESAGDAINFIKKFF